MPFERFVERLNSFSEGFVRKSVALKFGNNHVDPLAGVRRAFFVQTSEWKPRPEQIHPGVIRCSDAVASDPGLRIEIFLKRKTKTCLSLTSR